MHSSSAAAVAAPDYRRGPTAVCAPDRQLAIGKSRVLR